MIRLRDLRSLAALALGVVLALLLLSDGSEDAELDDRRSQALSALSSSELAANLHGAVEVFPARVRVRDSDLLRLLPANIDFDATFIYNLAGVSHATATAMGVDHHHYVVNAYLEGYMPFAVQNPFAPWYVIAKHKEYMYDHVQYPGREDIWQTSRQAFHAPRGDCEDHAILLADWLSSAGYDAWVALGYSRTDRRTWEGHAWVVLFHQGVEYLLEATQKDGLRRLTQLPLASLQTDYRPTMRFNRSDFYVNTGSDFTTTYRSPEWRKTSRFIRDANAE